jgi:hypothetical protein
MVTESNFLAMEQRVREAFARGEPIDLRVNEAHANDAANGGSWGIGRQVRAEVLAGLLRGEIPPVAGRTAALRLSGVRIVGRLVLDEAEIKQSVHLQECWLGDGLDLSEALTRSLDLRSCYISSFSLAGAYVDGHINLIGAHLVNLNGPALNADGLTVTRDMVCREGFHAEGEIRLVAATIGGALDLSGSHLSNAGGGVLIADGMKIAGNMHCRDGFRAEGEIHLIQATVGGTLDLTDAHLTNHAGHSLSADGMTIAGSMFCRGKFKAVGKVRLISVKIGGQLDLDGAHLANPGGDALTADRMAISGSVFCRNAFRADGEISLLGAHIGGRFRLDGAHLSNPEGKALDAEQMTVIEGMFCRGGFQVDGAVGLYGASIGVLCDDPTSWPQRLVLNGFTYRDLDPYLPAEDRLMWVRRMGDYRAQPYEQLTAYYRRLGHDEQARRVLLAQLRAQRKERPWWGRFWGWFQDMLAGYGYAPVRAVAWLLGTLIAGWLYFYLHHPAPVRPQEHPIFHAGLYSLDLMLPAPSLGQEQMWDPEGAALAIATMLRIFGWLLAITVVASITRALTRN